ncbi:MAG TPA: TetR/AcrR family transcriptional regulator [Actinomycetota bacterium]|jgi:AcrR family transcriptional regulator
MAAEADPTAESARPPGAQTRRRGETLERAIYDAVLAELQRVGITGMTMEGVASCAHTGKAALYRRWPRKEELVVDALDRSLPSAKDLPDHGDVREDLLDLLRRMVAMLNTPTGCALQALSAEVDKGNPLARLVKERVLAPRKELLVGVLRRGAERGQVRPGAVNQLCAEVGPAMVAQRFMTDGGPIPDAFVVSVVDDVVMPMVRP